MSAHKVISYFCLIYFVIGIAFLLIYRKVLAADKLLALICFYPWNVIAIMIQAFIPEYLVEMFLNTISLFLISNIVQRPKLGKVKCRISKAVMGHSQLGIESQLEMAA